MGEAQVRLNLLRTLQDSIVLLQNVQEMHSKPFDFIKGLDLVEVSTVTDLERLLEASYAITTWSETPYDSKLLIGLKNYSALNFLYCNLNRKSIGGGCTLAAEVFTRLLRGYAVRGKTLTYGLKGTPYVHTAVLVEFQGKEYVFDPFYGKYYINLDGTLITYVDMKKEIKDRTYRFEEVRVDVKKSVLVEDGWVEIGPQAFEYWMVEEKNGAGMDYSLREHGYTRPLDLMLEWTEIGTC